MYLHLGQNTIVRDREVIGIFDLDITSQSIRTRRYLSAAERAGEVTAVSEELPKSFVVTGRRGRQRVYISQLSTATLLRRSENRGLDG
ncbi:MAG: DUF370 domain-containing protein [Oscillospiraceae bacterium]|nr:DUF370 domain-containing protein [Oscillospiraceae bacterium]